MERILEKNYLKQTETNKIRYELLTMWKRYEIDLKEVTKLHDKVKRISKERERNRERSSAEIEIAIKKD